MLGILVAILGSVAAYRLWGGHFGLAILAIIATLYQASSLNEIFKEVDGLQPRDSAQTMINMVATLVIIGLVAFSLI
jgi:hypothetical protein